MIENLEAVAFRDPFPHLIFNDFYNKNELELIWEELNFILNQENFLQPKNYRWDRNSYRCKSNIVR